MKTKGQQSRRFGRVPGLKRVLECSYFGEVDIDFSSYRLRIEALDGRVIGCGSLTLGYRLRDGQLSYSHGHLEVSRAFGGRGRREIVSLAAIGEGDVLRKFRGYGTPGLEDTRREVVWVLSRALLKELYACGVYNVKVNHLPVEGIEVR